MATPLAPRPHGSCSLKVVVRKQCCTPSPCQGTPTLRLQTTWGGSVSPVGTSLSPHTMAGCPASEAWGGRKWALRRHDGRDRIRRQLMGRRGHGERRDGASCRTGNIGRRAAGQRVFEYQIPARTQSGFQELGQGQSLLVSAWGLWPRSQYHQSRGTLPCTIGEGGNVPNMASVLRASGEQRVQAAPEPRPLDG